MNTTSKAYSFHTKQNVVGAVSSSFTHRPCVYVFIASIQDSGYSGLEVFRTRRCFRRWYLGRMCLAWLCPNTKSQEAANKNMSGINHSMCVFTADFLLPEESTDLLFHSIVKKRASSDIRQVIYCPCSTSVVMLCKI